MKGLKTLISSKSPQPCFMDRALNLCHEKANILELERDKARARGPGLNARPGVPKSTAGAWLALARRSLVSMN